MNRKLYSWSAAGQHCRVGSGCSGAACRADLALHPGAVQAVRGDHRLPGRHHRCGSPSELLPSLSWIATGVGLSYRSLLEQVEELGRGLVGAGLGPGDVICLALPNCVQYPLVVLAGAAAQCVVRSVRCRVSIECHLRLLDMTRHLTRLQPCQPRLHGERAGGAGGGQQGAPAGDGPGGRGGAGGRGPLPTRPSTPGTVGIITVLMET